MKYLRVLMFLIMWVISLPLVLIGFICGSVTVGYSHGVNYIPEEVGRLKGMFKPKKGSK